MLDFEEIETSETCFFATGVERLSAAAALVANEDVAREKDDAHADSSSDDDDESPARGDARRPPAGFPPEAPSGAAWRRAAAAGARRAGAKPRATPSSARSASRMGAEKPRLEALPGAPGSVSPRAVVRALC